MRTDRYERSSDGEVVLYLTSDEALVLFDLLARAQDDDADDVVRPADEAEVTVLLRVRGVLDEVLVEPFRDDYRALVSAARERLRGPAEEL